MPAANAEVEPPFISQGRCTRGSKSEGKVFLVQPSTHVIFIRFREDETRSQVINSSHWGNLPPVVNQEPDCWTNTSSAITETLMNGLGGADIDGLFNEE